MGRSLQVLGLLIMVLASSGIILVGSGDPGLIALANPCVPPGLPSNALQQKGTAVQQQAGPSLTPTPNPLVRPGTIVTPPPSGYPMPAASRQPPIQLSSYPVFGQSENLATPTPTPTPTPLPSLTPEPSPTPTLPPCPSNTHRLFGSGPIEFSGNGSMDLGTHNSATTNSGLSETLDQNQYSVGMDLTATRRTDQSAITVSDAFGEYNGVGNAGVVTVGYSTPKYQFEYGPVSGPSDTQLSMGAFTQGVMLGVPHGPDEWDLIFARTTGGANGETFRVGAVRHSHSYRNGATLSQTLYDAFGEQGGDALTFDTAYTKFTASNTLRLEAAASNARNIEYVEDGTRFAYGLSEAFNGTRTSTSVSYTAIPNGYVSLGQVQDLDDQLQLTQRRPFISKNSVLTLAFSDSMQGSGTGTDDSIDAPISHTDSGTVNVNIPMGRYVNTSLLYNLSQGSSAGILTRTTETGSVLSEQLFNTSIQESYTTSLTTQTDATPQNTTDLELTLSRQFFGGVLSLGDDTTRATEDTAATVQSNVLASYARSVGKKTSISLSGELQKNYTVGELGTLINQFTTTISVTRHISPVVGLQTTFGRTHQTGAGGGSSSYFNVDLIGPLAIGTAARYSGRINPNLPAIIQGHVTVESAGTSYGLGGVKGIPNVLVTLDGGVTQRTDVTGSFEFRLVQPGAHIISVAPGTLPVGLIPDSTSQSITIQGGQVAQINFSAGLFGGIGGLITENVNGKDVPVPNVLVVVDDTQRGYTGTDGTYEIGHLDNGSHSVVVSPDSLPATLAVAGDSKQTISVSRGSVATANWKLIGLGSISGQVLFTADGGFGDLEPAANVYVVADPGQHAAITDDNGDYIIDNLEPGQYTLSLDDDTLPDGQSIIQGPDGAVNVEGGSAAQGVGFKLGPQAKMVVMGFGGANAAVNVAFRPERVPPNGTTQIIVTTNEAHPTSVTAQADVFGTVPLHFDPTFHAWVATIAVPSVQNSDYPVHVDVTGPKNGGADTVLTVDSKLPLILGRGVPANPKPGQAVHVILKVLASGVAPGDLVAMEDGTQLRLPEGRGNVYSFTITVKHPLPYRGLIFTKKGVRYPFAILP